MKKEDQRFLDMKLIGYRNRERGWDKTGRPGPPRLCLKDIDVYRDGGYLISHIDKKTKKVVHIRIEKKDIKIFKEFIADT